MPSNTIAMQSCTAEAPARILVWACSAVPIPPTPTSGIVQVGRDFQEEQDGAWQGDAYLYHPGQQGGQGGTPLQTAQAFGIGGGDDDSGKVSLGSAQGQHPREICRTADTVLVRTKVQPDGQAAGSQGKPGPDRLCPVIVEAETVDHRAVFGQAEQTRARIAGLRARRGGPPCPATGRAFFAETHRQRVLGRSSPREDIRERIMEPSPASVRRPA